MDEISEKMLIMTVQCNTIICSFWIFSFFIQKTSVEKKQRHFQYLRFIVYFNVENWLYAQYMEC